MVSYVFGFSGEIGEVGFFDVGFNTTGLAFAGDPSTLRVFEWDGDATRT